MIKDPTGRETKRAYRHRKVVLDRLQGRLRLEQRNWHAVWVRDEVPARAVRELVDELCKIAELEKE